MVAGTAFAALVLGAFTLRRRSGTLRPAARRALLVVPLVGVAVGGVWTAHHLLGERAYVTTDDARIDGDAIVLRAPATGTLVDWNAGQGSILHRDEPVGRIEINGGFGRPTQIIRAPADGTVVVDSGFEGNLVTAGAELAVAYDLSAVRVTAPIDETAIGDVHVGQPVDIERRRLPRRHVRRHRAGDPRRGRPPAVRGGGDGPLPADHPGGPGGHRDPRPRRPHPDPRHERHRADPPGPVTQAATTAAQDGRGHRSKVAPRHVEIPASRGVVPLTSLGTSGQTRQCNSGSVGCAVHC